MAITQRESLTHWNYFLCLEDDVSKLSRWVEFSDRNFDCFSIEMARLLMTASAEVDVVAKLLCKSLNPASRADGIYKYQEEITEVFPTIHKGLVTIPRYGIDPIFLC